MSGPALAYVNWGRWVADCPAEGCRDARELFKEGSPDSTITCVSGHTSTVQWPGGDKVIASIMAALVMRPDESTRAWFPVGHPMAEALNAPVDQSPADLQAETDAHAQEASEQRSLLADIASMIAGAGAVSLADLGLIVADDGTLTPDNGKV